eukprot:3867579-Rhodomonas_salina.4
MKSTSTAAKRVWSSAGRRSLENMSSGPPLAASERKLRRDTATHQHRLSVDIAWVSVSPVARARGEHAAEDGEEERAAQAEECDSTRRLATWKRPSAARSRWERTAGQTSALQTRSSPPRPGGWHPASRPASATFTEAQGQDPKPCCALPTRIQEDPEPKRAFWDRVGGTRALGGSSLSVWWQLFECRAWSWHGLEKGLEIPRQSLSNLKRWAQRLKLTSSRARACATSAGVVGSVSRYCARGRRKRHK